MLINLIHGIYDYLQQGGWIMIPLVACSVAMWSLIIERINAFRRTEASDIDMRDAIEAVRGSGGGVGGDGLRSRLVRNFLLMRSGDPGLDREILRQCGMKEQASLASNLSYIAVLAAVAPLMGLLGTVLGMIETFDVISVFGTGNARAMAGGISVALVTTQTGLLIAIPGILFSGILKRKARQLIHRLQEDIRILTRAVKHGERMYVPEHCNGGGAADRGNEPG